MFSTTTFITLFLKRTLKYMSFQLSLSQEEVEFDSLGRVIVKNPQLKAQLSSLVANSEATSCNTCTNTCGNSANVCGNTANGSCSSSFLAGDDILLDDENVIFKNPQFNTSILHKKLSGEQIDLEFIGLNTN